MHQGSYEKMAKFAVDYLGKSNTYSILEMGSQDVNGTYKPIFDQPNWWYVGCDMVEGKNVDIVLKHPYHWDEIATNSYDVVVSGSLLEHVEYPWITMLEVARILKPGGLTCHIAPAAGFEHRFPVDCYRYYPDGFMALCKWARLTPLQIYTDWHTNHSQDGGHVWKDSVMVAIKAYDREGSETLVEQMNAHLEGIRA